MSWGPGVEVRKGYIESPYLSSEQVKKVDALLETVTNSVSKLEVSVVDTWCLIVLEVEVWVEKGLCSMETVTIANNSITWLGSWADTIAF